MKKAIKISLFATFLLIGIIFNVGNTSAIKTTAVYASADTYANSDKPTQNFGTSTKISVGFTPNYLINYSGYLRFSLASQPANLLTAVISLKIDNHDSGSKTQIFKVFLIEESWDEGTLNHNNKPNPGAFITNLSITTDGFYSIDITDYASGRTNISIGLDSYVNESLDDYIEINSRENIFDSPRIVWTYDDPMDVVLVIITVSVIAGIIGAAGIAFYLYRKRIQSSYSRETPTPFEQGIPDRRQKKSDKICWYCEKPIPRGFNVCPNCGAELE